MSNATSPCPYPFLTESDFPSHGGGIDNRFCSPISPTIYCCLPCPSAEWLYSDNFMRVVPVANYVSIASFALNTLLLLTFAVLPEDQSHRHYLSVGLTVSLMALALAFIIPLGTKPDLCHNAITPNDMYTDLSCAWTGALLEAGAMGITVWILLRSIWTLLRAVFDFRNVEVFKWVSIALGVGLPALFLAVAMPISGVAYRVNNVCIPNNNNALPTWFAWILIFSTVASCLQIWTVVFCFWKFALSALARGSGGGSGTGQVSSRSNASDVAAAATPATSRRYKKVEWQRVKKLLALQWRSIVLTFIVVNVTIYFGIVFLQQIGAEMKRIHAPPTEEGKEWAICLITSGGDKNKCLSLSPGLGLSESRIIGTLILASFIGPIVFILMVRRSMILGWYELFRNPRRFIAIFRRRGSVGSQDFMDMGDSTKHMSLTKHLGSDQRRHSAVAPELGSEPIITSAGSGERLHSLEIGEEGPVGPKVEEERLV